MLFLMISILMAIQNELLQLKLWPLTFCPFTPWQSHFPQPEPAQPPWKEEKTSLNRRTLANWGRFLNWNDLGIFTHLWEMSHPIIMSKTLKYETRICSNEVITYMPRGSSLLPYQRKQQAGRRTNQSVAWSTKGRPSFILFEIGSLEMILIGHQLYL